MKTKTLVLTLLLQSLCLPLAHAYQAGDVFQYVGIDRSGQACAFSLQIDNLQNPDYDESTRSYKFYSTYENSRYYSSEHSAGGHLLKISRPWFGNGDSFEGKWSDSAPEYSSDDSISLKGKSLDRITAITASSTRSGSGWFGDGYSYNHKFVCLQTQPVSIDQFQSTIQAIDIITKDQIKKAKEQQAAKEKAEFEARKAEAAKIAAEKARQASERAAAEEKRKQEEPARRAKIDAERAAAGLTKIEWPSQL